VIAADAAPHKINALLTGNHSPTHLAP